MRVLTWNLYHGRARPPAGRSLLAEFAAAIARWDWDVALLQEVPPWWPPHLARTAAAEQRTTLTSRNAASTLRQLIAKRRPDLLGANGGGANTVLSRVGIRADRSVRLRVWPERRVAQVLVLGDGCELVNVHLSRERRRAAMELARAFALPQGRAVLGGDLNLRAPGCPAGFARAAESGVDHIYVRGMEPRGHALLDAGELSDHAPLIAEVA